MSDGIIKSAEAFAQPLHFEGVEFHTESNTITPTDIDAVLEFKDRLVVLVEVKRRNFEMRGGQRFAIERICKAIDAHKDKTCVAFKCWHDVDKPKPVLLRELYIQSYFWNFGPPKGYMWEDSKKDRPLILAINNLLDLVGIPPEVVSRCEFSEEISMADCPF